MQLMRQPCHLRLRLLIDKVLNTGKIILAERAKLCLDPIFIMQRIALEKVWRVSILCHALKRCTEEKTWRVHPRPTFDFKCFMETRLVTG